jgi:hypothetical protein
MLPAYIPQLGNNGSSSTVGPGCHPRKLSATHVGDPHANVPRHKA